MALGSVLGVTDADLPGRCADLDTLLGIQPDTECLWWGTSPRLDMS